MKKVYVLNQDTIPHKIHVNHIGIKVKMRTQPYQIFANSTPDRGKIANFSPSHPPLYVHTSMHACSLTYSCKTPFYNEKVLTKLTLQTNIDFRATIFGGIFIVD